MSDAHLLITENIDVWTTAIKKRSATGRGSNKKIEFTGIKKLRELILELAVRGQLAPQDPNDEPASVLMEKIAAEKAQLIKDKKIKKPKVLPEIKDSEKPFESPCGWKWVRLQEIINISSGDGLTSKQMNQNGNIPVYGGNGVTGFHDEQNVKKQTLVIGRVGFYCGSIHLTPIDAWVTDNAFITTFSESNIYINYLCWLLKATNLSENDSATAQPVISGRKVYPIIVCIPPLAEQHRIVAKVDELMALCDQLEQQTENSITAHQTLVETLLATLSNSENPAAFNQNWTRIAEHFDTLFTTEHSIDQLKQTILQLAVMGKIVPQNPNDEPASVLLEKIAAEKEQLIKDKKIKKQKPLPEITEDEKSFELPSGWKWRRIAEFTVVGTGSTPSRATPEYYNPAEINWVTSGETSNDFIFETKEKVSPKAIKETNVSIYPAGTLIVAMYGQGKTRGQITELMIDAGTNQACAAIRLIDKSANHRKYTKLYFQKAYKELRSHSAGGAQPNLNVGKISLTVLPIPPLSEQHRIVKKVDGLLILCDQLKARLSEAQTTQLHLADTIVEQAVD